MIWPEHQVGPTFPPTGKHLHRSHYAVVFHYRGVMRYLSMRLRLGVATLALLTGCQNAAVDSAPDVPTGAPPPATVEQGVTMDATDAVAPAENDLPVTKNPMMKKTVATAYNPLTADEERVIIRKGTERAFTGEYTDLKAKGTFICRRCNAPLYTSDAKFDSHCGWPSFDEHLSAAVERHPDPDGSRVEIVCANCAGHLGHVFEGEGFTEKNTRHCVNSVSMKFVADGQELPPVIVPDDK